MTDVKENTTEIVQDKGKNKVETKSSTPKRKASLTKECDVLVYNERTNTAIISFDGFGYELTGISKNPGLCICQRYCKDKSCYIPHNQDKMHCKYYEDC